jgi:hypothetical protein
MGAVFHDEGTHGVPSPRSKFQRLTSGLTGITPRLVSFGTVKEEELMFSGVKRLDSMDDAKGFPVMLSKT